MKTYDSLIRVSRDERPRRDRRQHPHHQRPGQREPPRGRDVGGRIGKTMKATDQSGFSVHESKAWQTAVERIRQGQSDGIVVAYDDRLGRNWRKAGPFYDAMEQAGGEILISAMPGVDYRTAEGRAMTGMLAVAAEMGYNAAKKRGDSIAQRTVDNGVPNRVPYGYRRNEQDGVKTDPDRHAKALVPDKHTAPTVKRIFKLRGDGESWTGIADALNNAGVPSPSGKRWTVQTLSSTVANDVYLGVVVLGDRRHEGAHTPLVTPAQWRAAQTTGTIHAQRQDDLGARGRRPAVLGVRPADARRQLRHQRQAAVLRVRAPVGRGPVPGADEREQGRRRRLRGPGDGRRDQGRRADPARVRPRARAGPPAGRGRHRAPEGVAQGAGHRRRWRVARRVRAAQAG